MTPLARIVAVVAGIVSLLLAGAALVRQAALAVDAGIDWRGSAWWTDLTGRSSTATIVAAAVTAAVTVVLIVFAYRQVSPAGTPQVIEFAVEDGTARLSVPALAQGAGAAASRPCSPARGSARSRSAGATTGWSVRVEADVPVCDLQDVHGAVLAGVPRRHAPGGDHRDRAARPRRDVHAPGAAKGLMTKRRPGNHQVFVRSRPVGAGVRLFSGVSSERYRLYVPVTGTATTPLDGGR